MKHKIFLAFFFLLMTACGKHMQPLPGETDHSYDWHPQHQAYQQILDQYQVNTRAPGSILYVSRPDHPEWVGAVGWLRLDTKQPMTVNTPFRIGSITKVFVAALILQLADKGVLSLSSKLQDLLPQVSAQIPGSQHITVHHLLAHLSGIYDPVNEDNQYKTDLIDDPVGMGKRTTEQLLDKYVYGKKLYFKPGSEYRYSNSGYWLLGLIAEKLSGKSLSDQLMEGIVAPLALHSTYLQKKQHTGVSAGYALVNNSTTPRITEVTSLDAADGDGKAAGGITSSAKDLGTFYRALFGGQLISAASLAEMKKIQLPTCNGEDCRYGLGLEVWKLGELTAFGHNGSSVGYECNALFFEKSKTVVVLFKNIGGGSDKRFFESLGQ
ncbi:MAG: beta-lactamase family protein [Williamsia sp.]|nr:beta-lactamase family protein [Williamsia sp.]